MAPKTLHAVTNGDGETLKVSEGKIVFSQGDVADSVFYMETGGVQLSVVSEQGKERIIALFGPGDFFGEGSLSAQPLRMSSATTTVPSTLVRIEVSLMHELLRTKPAFSRKFMAFLVQRNADVEAEIVDHLFNSSEKRLARLLLLLANFNNGGGLRPIAPKISQELLAARIGTTRSRINHFMNKFRRLGLIEYNGEVKVHPALLNIIVHD